MLTKFAKYNTLLIFGLLTAYLTGAFQQSALEILHTFSHLARQVIIPPEGDAYFHTHEGYRHAHLGQDPQQHRHPVITFLDQVLDHFAGDHSQQQQDKQQLKKKNPEPLPVAFETPSPGSARQLQLFTFEGMIITYPPSVPKPPPRA